LFKLPIDEKIERVTFLKNVSNSFFKAGKFDKAEKIFDRIN
jgi:lipopolysaccharide biosynthesis regulator YciM